MASKYLLILLPALVFAKIDVKISGKIDGEGDKSKLNVIAYGIEVGVISDAERTIFGLSDGNLKGAVKSCFGRKPDDVFVRSPTPYGDLYQSYCWPPVKRTLVTKGSRILNIKSEQKTVLEQIYENINYEKESFNFGMSASVLNTVSSSWSKVRDIINGPPINYEFDIDVNKSNYKTSYTSTWGFDCRNEKAVKLEWTDKDFSLEPRQRVMARIHATRATIEVEIEYEAILSGAVVVNYNGTYRNEQFWSLDIGAVMASTGLANAARSKEVVEMTFFSNSTLKFHKLPNLPDRKWHEETLKQIKEKENEKKEKEN